MRQTPRGFNALVVITGTVVFRTPPPPQKKMFTLMAYFACT